MSRIPKIVAALLMAGVGAVAGAETVYKWVDGAGQIHYTDLPPSQSDARILGIYQQEAGIVEESGEDGDFTEEGGDPGDETANPPEAPRSAEPPVSEEAMAAAMADAEKAKVMQCKEAQDRYQRYIESRRLFRETPDGKRQYLTDKELTEARARAKQDVTDTCG